MTDPNKNIALARLLYASAWVDGSIRPEEKSILDDFISKMPGLHEGAAQELTRLENTPISESKLEQYAVELRNILQTEAEKRFSIQAAQQIFISDGMANELEWKAIRKIVSILQSNTRSPFSQRTRRPHKRGSQNPVQA